MPAYKMGVFLTAVVILKSNVETAKPEIVSTEMLFVLHNSVSGCRIC